MRRHLIFDLDGTLVDSCAICVEILEGMLRERGSDRVIDPEFARPWMSHGGQKMVIALLGEECGDPAGELAEFRRRYAVTQTRMETLFNHVVTGLSQLQGEGFVLSICSNKPQNLVDKVLADTGLTPLFNSVVGARAGVAPKPAPDLLDLVLADLGAAPGDCLFVGDSELDHAVADARGLPFLFLTHGYAAPDYQPDPAMSYDCFGKLAEAVLERAHG
jgi:phosphoglycolate phosphatase